MPKHTHPVRSGGHRVVGRLNVRWALRIVAGLAILACLPWVLWACNSHSLEAPRPSPVAENQQLREINPIRNVDVLFVVDNSGSMTEEQMNLTRNFPIFMEELKKIEGADFHIAVTSTDLGGGSGTQRTTCPTAGGDRGVFCATPGKDCRACGLTAGNHLEYAGNGAATNFAGDISTVFSCMAALGTKGCSFEHSLESARRALRAPENKGFLRDVSYLAIIIITDEDDCSAPPGSTLFATDNPAEEYSLRCSLQGHICDGQPLPSGQPVSRPLASCGPADGQLIPVQQIVDDIVALKKESRFIITSGIFGWPLPGMDMPYAITRPQGNNGGRLTLQPICRSKNGSATAAFRVKKFVSSFTQSSFFSICQDDFRDALKAIGEKIKVTVGPPCVDTALVDTNPATKDIVEADCQVVDRSPVAGGESTDKALPKCVAGGVRPCWSLIRDPMCAASGHRIEVDRGGKPAAPGLVQEIKCLTCARPDCK